MEELIELSVSTSERKEQYKFAVRKLNADTLIMQQKTKKQKKKQKKNSNDYFKCKSLKRSCPLGASLHYPVLMDWDFLS
jgi:hypothetical protein